MCFVSNSGEGVYTNNPKYFDLLYYIVIVFATVGYGNMSTVSPSETNGNDNLTD